MIKRDQLEYVEILVNHLACELKPQLSLLREGKYEKIVSATIRTDKIIHPYFGQDLNISCFEVHYSGKLDPKVLEKINLDTAEVVVCFEKELEKVAKEDTKFFNYEEQNLFEYEGDWPYEPITQEEFTFLINQIAL